MHKFRLGRLTRSPYSCSHCYKCSTECWVCQSWESVQPRVVHRLFESDWHVLCSARYHRVRKRCACWSWITACTASWIGILPSLNDGQWRSFSNRCCRLLISWANRLLRQRAARCSQDRRAAGGVFLATGLCIQEINLRSPAVAVSGTEDGKRSRAAGEADTVVRTSIKSHAETVEARIIAI